MKKIIIEIDGMRCSMCEAHINNIVRKTYNVKKVKSSHKKGACIIMSDDNIDLEEIKNAITNEGYRILKVEENAA